MTSCVRYRSSPKIVEKQIRNGNIGGCDIFIIENSFVVVENETGMKGLKIRSEC